MAGQSFQNFLRIIRSLGWRGVAAALLVVFLILSTYSSLRKQGVKKVDTQSKLLLQSAVASKQAFCLSRAFSSMMSLQQRDSINQAAVKSLRKYALLSDNPKYWLELALLQFYLKDPGWATSLREVSSPSSGTLVASSWRSILQNKKFPQDLSMSETVTMVRDMRLGWYQHLALASVYDAGGQHDNAMGELDSAMQSALLLFGFSILGFIGGAIGLGLLIALGVSIYLHKQSPDRPLPGILTPNPPHPLDRKKGDLLYSVFIAYLLSFLLLRYFGSYLMSGLPIADRVISNPIDLTLALTLTLLSGLIPVLLLVIFGRRCGLKASDIGYRKGHIGMDMLWGVGGYLMGMPIIWFVTILFSAIFKHTNTPTNPAILAFTDSTSSLLKMFLFLEAALIAPFAEETMFRGVFFRGLSSRMKFIPSMLTASLVFAILHPQLPLGFPAIFLLAIIFNSLYLFRGSIIPNITAHALNNGFILLLLFLLLGK